MDGKEEKKNMARPNTVRPARPEDAEAVARLLESRFPGFFREMKPAPGHYTREEYEAEKQVASIRHVVEMIRENIAALVAERKGEIIGFVAGTEHGGLRVLIEGRYRPAFEAHALAVKRGNSAGKELLEALRRVAAQRGHDHMYLETGPEPALHRYYRMLGFEEIPQAHHQISFKTFRIPVKGKT